MEKLDKCKQIIIMISALLVILVMGIGVCYIVTYNKPEEKQEVKKEVASVVILDINPSIKLELDKDNKVISVTALNEDAKEIVSNNLEGKDLNEAVGTITDNLKEKGYAKEEVTILVNVTGKVTKEEIKTVIEETFEEKKVEVNVINQEITETSKENAEKYNITESKASYIEEVIKEKDNLTFEELKDKTIEELEEIKNKKEPEPSPSPSTTPTPSTSPKPTTTSSPKPSTTPKSSEEPRKGTNLRCESVKEAFSSLDDARDLAIERVSFENEDKKRNSKFGAQTTASTYNGRCVYETIIAYNKTMYYIYHDLGTGEYVTTVEKHVAIADYYDSESFTKDYLSKTYGVNPDDVQGRGMSGTITDKKLKIIAIAAGQKYTFIVNRETGAVENMVISEDNGIYY